MDVDPGASYRLTGFLRTSINSDAGFFGVRTLEGDVIAEAHFVSIGPWTRFTVDFESGGHGAVQAFAGVWTNSGDIWLQVDDIAIVRR